MSIEKNVKETLFRERQRLTMLRQMEGFMPRDEGSLTLTVRNTGRKEYCIVEKDGSGRHYAKSEDAVRVEKMKLGRRLQEEIKIREKNCQVLTAMLEEYTFCAVEEAERRLPRAYRGAFVPAFLEMPGLDGAGIGIGMDIGRNAGMDMGAGMGIGRDAGIGAGMGAGRGVGRQQVEPVTLTATFTQSENTYREAELRHRTSFGLAVRSKSELIIAEQLYGAGIPFHYEKKLILLGSEGRSETMYPDFSIPVFETVTDWLSEKGQYRAKYMLYWEHMGMMGDEMYREYALKKIGFYVENGIFMPQRLIVTMEPQDGGLDGEEIRRMIDGLILPQLHFG